jgi:hypothetical protein
MSTRRSRRKARQPQTLPTSVGRPAAVSRRQHASASWQGTRPDPTPSGAGDGRVPADARTSCSTAGQQLRTAHPGFGQMRRRALRHRFPLRQEARQRHAVTATRSADRPGLTARTRFATTFGSEQAPSPSSDREGSSGPQRGPDKSHHTHATRKSHWTWRFMSLPWDRHSFGRKRRSGRRSPSGSLPGDHVKVAGRGARTCRSGWLASQTGFGPVQATASTANPHGALRCHVSGSFGTRATRASDDFRVA